MNYSTQTPFEQWMTKMSALPLWVKQVLYIELQKDLETALSKATLAKFGEFDVLQLFVPQLTAIGQRELEASPNRLTPDLMKLLKTAQQQKTVVNICIANYWTLEQCAIVLLEALEKTLIHPTRSVIMLATMEFISGKSRLGDYLVKIGRVSTDALDQALRTQRYIEESMGEKTKIANILINLGHIQKQDTEGIIFLKEESKKRFPLDQFALGE